MRIAVLTANIGNFDEVYGIPKQDVEFEYFYYNENNLPFPLPNLDNRTKSKYLKLQTHRFLNHDLFIWVDASVEIKANSFVKFFIENAQQYDIALFKHQERSNVYDELSYISQKMKEGNKYLLSRYSNQQLDKEFQFYADTGFPRLMQLFSCFVFARWNTSHVNKAFDEWWKRSIEFSNFDQAMFSYIAYEGKLNIKQLEYDPIRTYKLFTRNAHI